MLKVWNALRANGYEVWIDIEHIKEGSTVSQMANAVDNASHMVYGVSKEYKESANCRLEALYAHQAGIPMTPLMLTPPSIYRPNGWLGMLLGDTLWFPFFGATLTDGDAFNERMAELCHSLGPPAANLRHQKHTAAPILPFIGASVSDHHSSDQEGKALTRARANYLPQKALSEGATFAATMAAQEPMPLSAAPERRAPVHVGSPLAMVSSTSSHLTTLDDAISTIARLEAEHVSIATIARLEAKLEMTRELGQQQVQIAELQAELKASEAAQQQALVKVAQLESSKSKSCALL